jgi:hypothetical protein
MDKTISREAFAEMMRKAPSFKGVEELAIDLAYRSITIAPAANTEDALILQAVVGLRSQIGDGNRWLPFTFIISPSDLTEPAIEEEEQE